MKIPWWRIDRLPRVAWTTTPSGRRRQVWVDHLGRPVEEPAVSRVTTPVMDEAALDDLLEACR